MIKMKKMALLVVTLITCQISASLNDQLRDAAQKGHSETVQMLLNNGAQVNATDNRGLTALMWAARYGHTEIVRALLGAGAEVNVKSNSGKTALKTALRLAANNGYTETVLAVENYMALHKEVSNALENQTVPNDLIKKILADDFVRLLKPLLFAQVADLIRKSDELKALIKPNGFIDQLLKAYEYKEKYKTICLISRAPETQEMPWFKLPEELINEICLCVRENTISTADLLPV